DRFDMILVAVGRRPTVPESTVAFEVNQQGFIRTDNLLKTSHNKIFAIGDITGPPLLAHRASHQGIMVAELIGGEKEYVLGPVPGCVFTHPEYAWVGATEDDLDDAIIGRFPISASGRAASMGERDGLCKVLIDRETQQIRGAQIVGPAASELIGSMVVAIKNGITAKTFEQAIHPHPTMSEILPEAVAAAFQRAIHVP
ncbi:MAG TPA: dihydrolipoyl dehydrogenase, partial [bacterium (Candidatus Stahlbacteria)]|nr:dihydrolipoyl dehydrogenase [Candidatus Stahlbacteria bacterium]